MFRHFARRCPRAVEVLDPAGQPPRNCDALLVDFNSVIHMRARAEPFHGDNHDGDYETRVIAGCVAHVERLVKRVAPSREVFLAVDGVPPKAKMQQQRARRYANDAARDSGCWDTNAITPGTRFMARLGAGLRLAFEGRASPAFVVSGADDPGEGEQKIFARLRGKTSEEGLAFVYGLDADLLLMAIAHTSHARIRVLRELDDDGRSATAVPLAGVMLQLIDVSALAKHASGEIARACGPGVAAMRNDADRIAEYVALCALLGNDFVPSLPSLSIRDGGMDAVVRAHGIALSTRPELEGRALARGGPQALGGMDVSVLSSIAEVLARDETGALEDRERRHAALVEQRRCGGHRAAKRSGDPVDDFPIRHPPEFGWIVYGRGGDAAGGDSWRQRYYRCLLLQRVHAVTVDEVHAIATAYAGTVAWSSAYLARGECLSIGWAYPHARAPTALDLHLALLSMSLRTAAMPAAFESADRAHLAYRSMPELRGLSDPAAAWQLMQVLPPRSAARLLEPAALALAKTTAFSHLYPATFRVCTYMCERMHECPVLLPVWSPAS